MLQATGWYLMRSTGDFASKRQRRAADLAGCLGKENLRWVVKGGTLGAREHRFLTAYGTR